MAIYFQEGLAVIATLAIYATFILIRLATMLVVKRSRVERLNRIIENWEERRRKAIEARNLKVYERIMREKSRVDRARSELGRERLKMTVISIAVWLAMFRLLTVFIDLGKPVILLPSPTNEYVKAPFYAWFLLNSIWANTLINRLVEPVFKTPRL